jgi:hypothetical protein
MLFLHGVVGFGVCLVGELFFTIVSYQRMDIQQKNEETTILHLLSRCAIMMRSFLSAKLFYRVQGLTTAVINIGKCFTHRNKSLIIVQLIVTCWM